MHCIPVTRAPVRPYKAARVIVHPPYNTPAVRTDPVVRERPAHPPTPSLPPFCWSCLRPSGFARPCLFRSHHRTVFAKKSQFSTLILYSFCRTVHIGTSVSIKMLSIFQTNTTLGPFCGGKVWPMWVFPVTWMHPVALSCSGELPKCSPIIRYAGLASSFFLCLLHDRSIQVM